MKYSHAAGSPADQPRRRRLLPALVVTVVVALLATGTYNIFGASEAEGSFAIEQTVPPEPVFEPKDTPGEDAFFPLATQIEMAEEELGVEILDEDVKTGLYGGTEENTCDPERMISFLLANPDIGHAWADVQDITFAELPAYIRSLDVRVLADDYEAINHGYKPEHQAAYEIDSILAAGTAVLVDKNGDVRARCYCGNPIKPKPPTGNRPRCVSFAAPIFGVPGDRSTRKSGVPSRVDLTGQESFHQGSRWLEISWAGQTGWVQDFFVEAHRCPPVNLTWCAGPGIVDVFDTPQPSTQTKVGELNSPINTITGVQNPQARVTPVGGNGYLELNGFVMVKFDHAAPSSASTAWVAMRDLIQSVEDCDPLLVCVTVPSGIASRGASSLTVRPSGTYFVEILGFGAPASATFRQVRIADGTGDLGWIDQTATMRLWDECIADPPPPPPPPPQFCVGMAPNATAWDVWNSRTTVAVGDRIAQVHRQIVTVVGGPIAGRYQVELTNVGPTGWVDAQALTGTYCEPYLRCIETLTAIPRLLGDSTTDIPGTPGGPFWATIYGVTALDSGQWHRYTKVHSLPDAGWLEVPYITHNASACDGTPPPPPPPPEDCVADARLNGLAHWWTFDQTDGPTDRKGANNGTPTGGLGVTAPVNEGVSLAAADRINYAPYVPSGAFTVDAWVRVPAGATPGTHTILDTRDTHHQGFFAGIFFYQSQFWLEVQVNDGPISPATAVHHFRHGGFTQGTWHFISVTVDPASGVVLNIDGNRSGLLPAPTGPLYSWPFTSLPGGSVMSSGFQTNGWPVDGAIDIDELEIFDYAVDDALLDDIQAAGPDGKCRVWDVECSIQFDGPSALTGTANPSAGAPNPLTYQWDFGGFGTFNGQNPSGYNGYMPAWAQAGFPPFTVTLTVTDPDGNTKSFDCGGHELHGNQFDCGVGTQITSPPVRPGDPTGTITVKFNGNAPAGTFDNFKIRWHFGDANTHDDTVTTIPWTNQSPQHSYGSPGSYDLGFELFDPLGNLVVSVPRCQQIVVIDDDGPPPVYDYECVSDSGATPSQIILGASVGGWSVNITPSLPGATFVWHLDHLSTNAHTLLSSTTSHQSAVTPSTPGQYRVRVEVLDAQAVNVKDLDCATFDVVKEAPPVSYEYWCVRDSGSPSGQVNSGSMIGGWTANIAPSVSATFRWELLELQTNTNSVVGGASSYLPAMFASVPGQYQLSVTASVNGSVVGSFVCDTFEIVEELVVDNPTCSVTPPLANHGQAIDVTVSGFSGQGWNIDYAWTANGQAVETANDPSASSPATDRFDYLYGQTSPDLVGIQGSLGGRSFNLSCQVSVCPAETEVQGGECVGVVSPPPPPPTGGGCQDGDQELEGRCFRPAGRPLDTSPPQCQSSTAVLIGGLCYEEVASR